MRVFARIWMIFLLSAVRGQEQMMGGYSPVDDVCSSDVQAAGKVAGDSACAQLNEPGCTYTVVSAQEQVVEGLNYDLTMAVTDANGACTDAFQSVVYVPLEGAANVTSMDPLTCDNVTLPATPCPDSTEPTQDQLLGGYKDITALCADDVQAAAAYAVADECPISFSDVVGGNCTGVNYRVVEGQEQVVAGMNYYLKIAIVDDTNTCLYVFSGVIYVPPGADPESVSSQARVGCSTIAAMPEPCMLGQDGSGEPPVSLGSAGDSAGNVTVPETPTITKPPATSGGTKAPVSSTKTSGSDRVYSTTSKLSLLAAAVAMVLL